MCGLGQVFTAKGVRHKVQDFKNFIGSENVDRHADVVHRVWAAEIRVAECNKQGHAAAGGPVNFARQIVHLSHEYQHS